MHIIKVPASTSNLSVGFDILGLAFNIYNTFDVELSDKDRLINVEEQYNNSDNLFLKAYREGLKKIGTDDHVRVYMKYDVPIERGLGSSSTLIVGGLMAASVLHNNCLSKDEIFELAAKMEGHPDNAAPCVYGGFIASLKDGNEYITHNLKIDESYRFAVFVPDFAVSTQKARSILPVDYKRQSIVNNSAKAIYLSEALRTGDMELLKKCYDEDVHESFRKQLIDEFEEVKKLYIEDTDGVFFISGSGSTCLGISKKDFSKDFEEKLSHLNNKWEAKKVRIDYDGATAYEI